MNTIYQLYYNEASLKMCSPASIKTDTSGTVTPFLEAYWMNTLPIPGSGYMAVLSPRFEQKTGLSIARISRMNLRSHIHSPYRYYGSNNIWNQGDKAHQQLREITAIVFRDAGLSYKLLAIPTWNIYCNYFIMRVDYWWQFKNEMLSPVINACIKNKDIVFQHCHYNPAHGKATPEQLMKATGFPHYTYAPFICERLIGTWAAHKKLNVKPWIA